MPNKPRVPRFALRLFPLGLFLNSDKFNPKRFPAGSPDPKKIAAISTDVGLVFRRWNTALVLLLTLQHATDALIPVWCSLRLSLTAGKSLTGAPFFGVLWCLFAVFGAFFGPTFLGWRAGSQVLPRSWDTTLGHSSPALPAPSSGTPFLFSFPHISFLRGNLREGPERKGPESCQAAKVPAQRSASQPGPGHTSYGGVFYPVAKRENKKRWQFYCRGNSLV